jgi:hypothetical protein
MREFERLLNAADGDDQAFLRANERLFKMRLYQITGDPIPMSEPSPNSSV